MLPPGLPPLPPPAAAFWALAPGPSGLDSQFVTMLRAATFLAGIWLFGRIMATLKLPNSIGGLLAGMLLGPEGIGVVPYATKLCSTAAREAAREAAAAAREAAAAAAESLMGNASTGVGIIAASAAGAGGAAGGGAGAVGACGDYDVWRLMGNTGITLLIFEFGTHVNLQKVHLVLRKALKVTAVSTILPTLVGVLLIAGIFSDGDGHKFVSFLPDGFAAGVALSPTSPVVLRVLDEDDLLNTLPGQTALIAIFLSLVVSLIFFTVLTNVATASSLSPITLTSAITRPLVCSVLFVALGQLLALKAFPHLEKVIDLVPRVGRVSIQPRDELHLILMLVTLVLCCYLTAMLCGNHLLGAFVGGMCFVRVGRSRQVWRVQLKRIRAWCVRIFYAATVGFAVPITSMADGSLIFQGLLLGLCGGIFAKLLSPLTIRFMAGKALQAERLAARKASALTRSGHVEPAQLIVGASMVARGEFSFLIADEARRTLYAPSGQQGR
jgi:Kef-type K+ transport system membrane component KefB